jgi:hypothetical protein
MPTIQWLRVGSFYDYYFCDFLVFYRPRTFFPFVLTFEGDYILGVVCGRLKLDSDYGVMNIVFIVNQTQFEIL